MSKFGSFKQKVKNNLKKNKVATIILITIWIITVVGTLFYYDATLGKQSYGNGLATSVVELYDGVTIKQTAPVTDGTESVAIKFATYARKNKGSLTVQVVGNNTRTTYITKEINTKNINDNAFLTVKLNRDIVLDKEQFVTVILTSSNTKDNSIGVYYSDDKVFEMSEFSINNELQAGDLGVRFLTNSEPLTKFYKMLITWTITSITFLILFFMLIEPKLEIFFAVMTAMIGLTFCFLMTPLSIPDEFAHFEYSIQVSNYMTFEDNHILVDGDYKDYGSYRGHHNVSSAYEKIMRRWNSEFVPDGVMEEMDNDVADIYKLCFVPSSIGVTIARLLKFNRVKLFYLGRMFNLAFYVSCIYLAIKKTPIHKLLFGILATVPMFMQQAASYSYDCFVFGLSFVTIGYLLNFIFRKDQITNKEIIFVLIVNALLAPAKIVYGFFSLLFWLVPSEKYGSKKKKILCSLLLCCPAIYQLLKITMPILEKVFDNLSELAYDAELNLIDSEWKIVEEKITVGYMVRHPLETISLFTRTIRYSMKNWFYDSLGRTLSGMSIVVPVNLVHLLIIAPIVSAFTKEEHIEPLGLKIGYICVCLIIALYVMGGFVLSWTDMSQAVVDDFGGVIIQGIQGRYFSPLLPFAYSIFNNKKLAIPQKYNKYIIYIQLLVLFEVVVYVLSFTFVN